MMKILVLLGVLGQGNRYEAEKVELDESRLVIQCLDTNSQAIEIDGKDCKGNDVTRTRLEDEFARLIIETSDGEKSLFDQHAERTQDYLRPGRWHPDCLMQHIARSYLNGAESAEQMKLLEPFREMYDRVATSPGNTSCAGWTSFFLDAEATMFKAVSDGVKCTIPDSILCPWAMKHGELLRAGQGIWARRVTSSGLRVRGGRVEADIEPLSLRNSADQGISMAPDPRHKFPKAYAHAKGIFAPAPEGDPVADNYRKCGAPFVAGASGTMWNVLQRMMSDKDWMGSAHALGLPASSSSVCSEFAQIAQMQFAASLVLGGHHSWTEVCVVLQEFHQLECPEAITGAVQRTHTFRDICALDGDAVCQGDNRYNHQMDKLKELWFSLNNYWDDLKSTTTAAFYGKMRERFNAQSQSQSSNPLIPW